MWYFSNVLFKHFSSDLKIYVLDIYNNLKISAINHVGCTRSPTTPSYNYTGLEKYVLIGMLALLSKLMYKKSTTIF